MQSYQYDTLEGRLSAEFGGQLRTELAHDPQLTHWQSLFDQSNGCRIYWGQVVDVIPFVNAYRVCAGARSYLWCCDSSAGSYQPFGARPVNTIPIGSFVFYIVHPQVPWWGTIIGAEPPPLQRNQFFRADYVYPGSNCGIRVDPSHRMSIQGVPGAAGIVNWSAGRPVDQTTIGEWGKFTETGMGVYLDPFLGYMRVNEATGLFLFYHDSLARLAGYNLQIRSCVNEREDLDDEGEISQRQGSALYFWELYGAFLNEIAVNRNYTVDQVQGKNPEFSTIEPAFDDQQPFFRLDKAEGYLGQGGRRSLCLPSAAGIRGDTEGGGFPAISGHPISADDLGGSERQINRISGTLNRYSSQNVFSGVFEESLSVAGAWGVRSAKRIILAKRPSIPIPKLIKRPEDTSGDTTTNYNAAGGLNAHDAHFIAGEPLVAVKIDGGTAAALAALASAVAGATSGADAEALIEATADLLFTAYPDIANNLEAFATAISMYPSNVVPHLSEFGLAIARVASANPTSGLGDEPPSNIVRAASVLDLGAFNFNWSALHPYAYHDLDYYLPEETDLPISANLLLPKFSDLQSDQYLKAPPPIGLPIDHRMGQAYYFPNESIITLLDDGGIMLGDGYGAEITLSGGSVWIRAPGDIWFQSGKNTNIWAGWDAIIRARNSVDVTASRKDIHLKADQNIMGLAGNSGCGGVFLESRATCASYDYDGTIGEDVRSSGIVFNAPNSQVLARGRDVIIRADPEHSTSPGTIVLDASNRVKVYTDYMERFLRKAAIDFFVDPSGSPEGVNEYWASGTLFGEDVRVAGHLAVTECSWFDANVIISNGYIASEEADANFNLVANLEGQALTDAHNVANTTNSRVNQLNLIVEGQEYDFVFRDAINAAYAPMTFSLRNSGQYLTETFIIMEGRWQQMARLGGATLPFWDEPVVLAHSTPTLPHPGVGAWTGLDEESNPVYSYYQQDLDLYSFSSGEGGSNSRSSFQDNYETPVYRRPDATNLADNYQIIVST